MTPQNKNHLVCRFGTSPDVFEFLANEHVVQVNRIKLGTRWMIAGNTNERLGRALKSNLEWKQIQYWKNECNRKTFVLKVAILKCLILAAGMHAAVPTEPAAAGTRDLSALSASWAALIWLIVSPPISLGRVGTKLSMSTSPFFAEVTFNVGSSVRTWGHSAMFVKVETVDKRLKWIARTA